MFGPFWAKMWVQFGSKMQKGYFHTSYDTPNPVFPENEVLTIHSLLIN